MKSNTTTKASPAEECSKPEAGKKRGWDEIEMLFDGKKKSKEQKTVESTKAPVRRSKQNNKHDARPLNDDGVTERANRNDHEWVNDGLGGKYNADGFTGRVEDGCKIFKAHLLSKPHAGQSPLCPFDCTCCYI